MAIFDFLFGSRNPPPVETTNITTQEIPKYIAEPTADIIGEAMDVAKEGYIPYQGARLAGFRQDELDAMQGIRDMQGVAGLRGGQAFTAATAAGVDQSSAELSALHAQWTHFVALQGGVQGGRRAATRRCR